MFQFLFRVLGLIVLALALVLAVLDVTRSISAASFITTSLAEVWQGFNPQTLTASQEAVSNLVHPWLWDPMIKTALALPSWLIFWLGAMVLLWLGQKRENPYGRFASR